MPPSPDALQGDFSSLFNFLPIGAYRTRPDGTMLRVNPAFVALAGYDDEAQMLADMNLGDEGWYVVPRRRAEFRRLLDRDGFVRGYGYQRLGPRDADNDPIGGRSLAEFSLEARVRFGVFGVVPFVDAGNIYTESLPRLDKMRFGAGLGGRYYSSFGPIRIDIGTPINRRTGEARVTVFVSLGQAF